MTAGIKRVARGRRDGQQVVVDCPYCDDVHRHGLTGDLKRGELSERVTRCGGYYVALEGAE